MAIDRNESSSESLANTERLPIFLHRKISSAKFRLRIVLIISLGALLLMLINFPVSGGSDIFSAGSLGNLLILGIALWSGLQIAALLHIALYDVDSPRNAAMRILGRAFGIGIPSFEIGQEKELNPEFQELDKAGGPAHINIHMDSALVLESSEGHLRVLGPSENTQLLESFERIRAVIDLRDQIMSFNISSRTRDGVRIRVHGVRIVYSVVRGRDETSLARPYPFSTQATIRLVRFSKNERTSNLSASHSAQNLIAEQGREFFEREVQQFIGQIWLSDLLVQNASGGNDSSLLLAREEIRNQFVESIRSRAFEQGIELQWIDIGTWKSDELAQEILEDYQQGQMDNIPYSKEEIIGEQRAEELQRLFDELLPKNFDERTFGSPEEESGKFLSGLFGLLDGLKLRYGEKLDEDGDQVETLLRFLRILSKRTETDKN
jgi:hypothetical protein